MSSREITYTALFLALAIVFPIAFHQFGLAGRIFLPMHFPVLICAFLLGPGGGILVGLLAPFLSHLLTGMPPTYAVPLMTMELPMYGLVAGLAYRRLKLNMIVSLVAAMVVGRLAFALGLLLLGLFIELPYGPLEYIAVGGALLAGWPGIIIQLFLVPLIVRALEKSGTAP